MRIYIRHAEKLYANGKNHTNKHDPPLTSRSKDSIIHKTSILIEKYGIPKFIYISPFLRTRETAKIMIDCIPDNLKKDIIIFTENSISEYLGNQDNNNLSLTKETLESNPPVFEDIRSFKSRISNHESLFSKKDENLSWFITHGLVIQTIAEHYKSHIKHVPYLGSISISNSILTIDF